MKIWSILVVTCTRRVTRSTTSTKESHSLSLSLYNCHSDDTGFVGDAETGMEGDGKKVTCMKDNATR